MINFTLKDDSQIFISHKICKYICVYIVCIVGEGVCGGVTEVEGSLNLFSSLPLLIGLYLVVFPCIAALKHEKISV